MSACRSSDWKKPRSEPCANLMLGSVGTCAIGAMQGTGLGVTQGRRGPPPPGRRVAGHGRRDARTPPQRRPACTLTSALMFQQNSRIGASARMVRDLGAGSARHGVQWAAQNNPVHGGVAQVGPVLLKLLGCAAAAVFEMSPVPRVVAYPGFLRAAVTRLCPPCCAKFPPRKPVRNGGPGGSGVRTVCSPNRGRRPGAADRAGGAACGLC
jgi:hypothetical protein